MGFVDSFFALLRDFFTWPFHAYTWNSCGDGTGNCAHPQRDALMTVVAAAAVIGVVVFIVFLLALLMDWLYHSFVWYSRRQHCAHCSAWTLERDQGKFPKLCVAGQPCCPGCNLRHQADSETRRACCNADCRGAKMEKQVHGDEIIMDVCPRCGGVFLDRGELARLRQISIDEDDDATSILLGAALISSVTTSAIINTTI